MTDSDTSSSSPHKVSSDDLTTSAEIEEPLSSEKKKLSPCPHLKALLDAPSLSSPAKRPKLALFQPTSPNPKRVCPDPGQAGPSHDILQDIIAEQQGYDEVMPLPHSPMESEAGSTSSTEPPPQAVEPESAVTSSKRKKKGTGNKDENKISTTTKHSSDSSPSSEVSSRAVTPDGSVPGESIASTSQQNVCPSTSKPQSPQPSNIAVSRPPSSSSTYSAASVSMVEVGQVAPIPDIPVDVEMSRNDEEDEASMNLEPSANADERNNINLPQQQEQPVEFNEDSGIDDEAAAPMDDDGNNNQ